jgi:hypothetical protein
VPPLKAHTQPLAVPLLAILNLMQLLAQLFFDTEDEAIHFFDTEDKAIHSFETLINLYQIT